jgi:hypothetical protein
MFRYLSEKSRNLGKKAKTLFPIKNTGFIAVRIFFCRKLKRSLFHSFTRIPFQPRKVLPLFWIKSNQRDNLSYLTQKSPRFFDFLEYLFIDLR